MLRPSSSQLPVNHVLDGEVYPPDAEIPTEKRKRFRGDAWTDTRVELLKKLWADGLSASQIAAELGGITRNAVIGKVHRLGLSGRAKSPSSSPPRPRKVRMRSASSYSRPARIVARGNLALAYEYEPVPEPKLFEIPVEQRKTLLQLNERTCHWPVGDPGSGDFYFCGGDALSNLPYCVHHCRMSYQPAAERRRDVRPSYR